MLACFRKCVLLAVPGEETKAMPCSNPYLAVDIDIVCRRNVVVTLSRWLVESRNGYVDFLPSPQSTEDMQRPGFSDTWVNKSNII